MLEAGFVIPTCGYYYQPFRNQPLVALYLLTILEDRLGGKTSLSLIDLRGVSKDNLLFHIPEKDIFFYSVGTQDFYEISSIVQGLRQIYPKAKHIAGGPHITLFPEESAKIFDSIVLGEGEESIVNAVEDVSLSCLKAVYRQAKPVNLDAYSYASRKYLPRKAVVDTGLLPGKYQNLPGTAFIFSRGCPFDCYFCANRDLNLGPVRVRSPKLVAEEIEYLKCEYKIEALAFKDDNAIPVDRKVAIAHLEAIAKTGIKWRGQSRANGIRADVVKLAQEAGCVDIALGIESVCQNVLKIINKRIDINEAKEYIWLLKKTGIGVRFNLIIGLPGEPDDIVERTLAFIDETEPTSVLLSYLYPVPGSELFKNPKRFGITINTFDWRRYTATAGRFSEDELPDIIFDYDQLTPWGAGMSKSRIFQNYVTLQGILRKRGLNF
ncbi:radical SAM protein [bacterium]|nr:MAG: radical SAM protein [bacterium]